MRTLQNKLQAQLQILCVEFTISSNCIRCPWTWPKNGARDNDDELFQKIEEMEAVTGFIDSV